MHKFKTKIINSGDEKIPPVVEYREVDSTMLKKFNDAKVIRTVDPNNENIVTFQYKYKGKFL